MAFSAGACALGQRSRPAAMPIWHRSCSPARRKVGQRRQSAVAQRHARSRSVRPPLPQ